MIFEAQEEQFPLTKPATLLAYLACRHDWVSRDELLLVFYPDVPEKTARHRLRQLTYKAKKVAWAVSLEVTDESLRWQVKSDFHAFRKALEQNDYEAAVRLYQGEFLKGIRADDSLGFETWLELQRHDLAEACLEASLKLAKQFEQLGKTVELIALLKHQLTWHPLSEDLLRLLMRAYYLAGDKDAALKRYVLFAEQLAQDMQLEPDESTQELLAKIQRGESLVLKQHNLPVQTTPFVGRDAELTQLEGLFAAPDCRLLTLLAAGGMGKTRLSLAFAARQLDQFRDGVFFVPLESVTTASALYLSIAEALSLNMHLAAKPKQQVLDYLRDKEILLLLDNFEQLTNVALELRDVFEGCAGVKLIVTSREPLKLRVEHTFALTGLAAKDALKLFAQTARRLKHDVDLIKAHDAVIEICRLVEGMPLAIELAAAWVGLLEPKAIAAEIKRDLSFLSTDLQDYPERHKSIYRLVQVSCQQLDEETQSVFTCLSIFVAPFSQEAAQQISNATLRQLLSLEQRLLLRRSAEGLFDMHPLIRQFAFENLRSHVSLFQQSQSAMIDFYQTLLISLIPGFDEDEQAETLGQITQQLANSLQALSYAASKPDEEFKKALFSLQRFYTLKGFLQEGFKVFRDFSQTLCEAEIAHYCQLVSLTFAGQMGEAVSELELKKLSNYYKEQPQMHLLCLNLQAEQLRAQGQYEKAKELHLSILPQIEKPRFKMAVLEGLGASLCRLAEWQRAQICYQQALELAQSKLDKARIISRLADLQADLGHYDEAIHYFQQSLQTYETLGAEFDTAWVANNLATIYHVQKDYKQAEHYYQIARKTSQKIGDRHGVALASMNLAELAFDQNHLDSAIRTYEATLELYQSLKDAWHETKIHALLASAYLAEQREADAKNHLQAAARQAQQLNIDTLSIEVVFHMACYLKQVKNQSAEKAFALIWHHPASTEDQRVLIRNYLKTDRPNFKEPESAALNEVLAELNNQLYSKSKL